MSFDRNQIKSSLKKSKKHIEGLEKLKNPDRLKKKNKPTFINRNIYLAKKFRKRVKDHGMFCTCSLDPGSSTPCGSDCNCGILLSSCSSSCKYTSECTNKPFQQRHIKKMKLVQTEKCGYGIAANLIRLVLIIWLYFRQASQFSGKKKQKLDASGQSWNNHGQRKIRFRDCIGVVILLTRPINQRCFGIITQSDEFSRNHLVMYEDGVIEIVDLSNEAWKIVAV